MKIIAANQMKRGDHVIHDKQYIITYIYLDKVEKKAKYADLTAFAVLKGQEKRVKEWFHKNYPYEALKVEYKS